MIGNGSSPGDGTGGGDLSNFDFSECNTSLDIPGVRGYLYLFNKPFSSDVDVDGALSWIEGVVETAGEFTLGCYEELSEGIVDRKLFSETVLEVGDSKGVTCIAPFSASMSKGFGKWLAFLVPSDSALAGSQLKFKAKSVDFDADRFLRSTVQYSDMPEQITLSTLSPIAQIPWMKLTY